MGIGGGVADVVTAGGTGAFRSVGVGGGGLGGTEDTGGEGGVGAGGVLGTGGGVAETAAAGTVKIF